MASRPDERIGMEYDVPERYADFIARTGLPPDICTFCKGMGFDSRPAYVVRRRWQGRELGQLLTYCDVLHHFDPEHGRFYGDELDEPLGEICPECWTKVTPNGTCMCD